MITKTGFPPGRPRRGELRPVTSTMVRSRERYAKQSQDPLFRAARARKQAEWRAAHPDREREISLNAKRREKLWAEYSRSVAAKR